MINVDYKGLEIGTLTAYCTSNTFVPGRPVKIGSTGVIPATINAKVLGLCKEAYISGTIDECNSGQYGIYGSGKITVLASGVATIQNSVYNGTSYSVYDTTQTYVAGQKLYVDTNGYITNSSSWVGTTGSYVGVVLSAPTNPANGDPMQILVQP